MAARKKNAGKKAGKARPSVRKGGAKSAKRSGKKSPARRPAKKAPARKAMKKSPARKPAKKASSRKASSRKSPIQRVASVAKQVAQQAQAAVSGGVEALRELSENLAERVGGQGEQAEQGGAPRAS